MSTARQAPVRAALAGLALAVLVGPSLAACAGREGGGAPEESTQGPLDAYREQIYGGDDDGAAQSLRFEETVAACMAEQGFEYIPVDQTGGTTFRWADFPIEWGSREFVEQYGYGRTTNPWGIDDTLPDDAVHVDPNADYVAGLTATERAAYELALQGVLPEPGQEEEEGYDWGQEGCNGIAMYEVYLGGAVGEEFAALRAEMDALESSVKADPRVQEARAAWSACLVDAGYPTFTGQFDPWNWITEQSNALNPTAEDDWAPVDPQRVADLHQTEIDLALADLDCTEQTGVADVEQAVTLELEQAFVDAHRDELDAWVEKWAEDP